RAGHRRNQPRRPTRRAGSDLEPLGATAAANRGPVRPVHRTDLGTLVVRHLRRRPVHPRRHPSGVTLAPEGGAHQSITTPSIGIEQPGCLSYEPAFAIDVEWTLLACLARLAKPGGTSAYLRLSTRPVDQTLAGRAGRSCRPRAPAAAGSRGRVLPAPHAKPAGDHRRNE